MSLLEKLEAKSGTQETDKTAGPKEELLKKFLSKSVKATKKVGKRGLKATKNVAGLGTGLAVGGGLGLAGLGTAALGAGLYGAGKGAGRRASRRDREYGKYGAAKKKLISSAMKHFLAGGAAGAVLPAAAIGTLAAPPLIASALYRAGKSKGRKEEEKRGSVGLLSKIAPYLVGSGVGAAGIGIPAVMASRSKKEKHKKALSAADAKRKKQLGNLAGMFRRVNAAENKAIAKHFYRRGASTKQKAQG